MKAAALEEDRADWFADARFMIRQLAFCNQTLTADDLRLVMRPAPVANWTGLAFTAAHKAGDIEWVRYVRSNNKTRRGGSVSEWRRKQEGVTP
jgi:hypothetical protein